MTTIPLHTLLIPHRPFLWAATALSPGARSVAPRSPPEQIHSPGKQSFAMDQNLLFLGVSETPKTDLQSGSIKVAMPGSISVASDTPRL